MNINSAKRKALGVILNENIDDYDANSNLYPF